MQLRKTCGPGCTFTTWYHANASRNAKDIQVVFLDVFGRRCRGKNGGKKASNAT